LRLLSFDTKKSKKAAQNDGDLLHPYKIDKKKSFPPQDIVPSYAENTIFQALQDFFAKNHRKLLTFVLYRRIIVCTERKMISQILC